MTNLTLSLCRKSTFPSAKRFVDPQVIYGPRMANFSLIDINDYFKNRNGAPRLDKYSFRPDFYRKENETEEEIYLRRYALLKPA